VVEWNISGKFKLWNKNETQVPEIPQLRLLFFVCAVNPPNGWEVKGESALQEMKAFKGLFDTVENKRDCLAEIKRQQLKEWTFGYGCQGLLPNHQVLHRLKNRVWWTTLEKGSQRAFQVGIKELNHVNRLLRSCYNKRCQNRLNTKEVGKLSTKDDLITDSAASGIKTAGLLFRLL